MRKSKSDAPNTPQELRDFTEALRSERDAAIAETAAITEQTAVMAEINERLKEIEYKQRLLLDEQGVMGAKIDTLVAIFRERKEANGKRLERLTEELKDKVLEG